MLLLSAISLIAWIISRGLIMKTAKIFFILTVLLLTVSLFTGTASANIGGSSGTFRISCNVENATVALVSISNDTYDFGQIRNGYLDAEIYLLGTPFKQIIVDAGDPFDPITYEITAYPESGETVEVTINFPVRDVWWMYDSSNTTLHISNKKEDDSYAEFTADEQESVKSSTIPWHGCQDTCTKVVIEGEPAPSATRFWFYNFSELSEIENLDRLDTSNVTDMRSMFEACCKLTVLCTAPDADWSGIRSTTDMFVGCENLVGGNGTGYDENHTDGSYARTDKGEDAPGYFTTLIEYDLWVGGKRVTNANQDNIFSDPGEPSAKYDPVNKTLTVTGTPAITGTYNGALIYADGIDLTINAADGLGLSSDAAYRAVYVYNGNLTINGNATTELPDGSYAGIAANAITVNGDVSVTGASYGLYTQGSLVINGNVTGTTGSHVLYSGNLQVTGNVDATSTGNSSYPICTIRNLNIDGSAIIKSPNGNHYGISGLNIAISGDVTVTGSDIGLRAYGGKVYVGSGRWDIDAKETAIYAAEDIIVPDTHSITTPKGGGTGQVNKENRTFFTVTESDGKTAAKHAVIEIPAYTIRADAGARGIISPSGNVSVETGEKITFRMIPYTGWHISDVIVDGVSVGAVSSYTFEAVDADHTISVRYEADDTSTTVPKTIENLEKLIDHMVNNTPLDGNYDFNQDFRVNGKDVILLEMMIE